MIKTAWDLVTELSSHALRRRTSNKRVTIPYFTSVNMYIFKFLNQTSSQISKTKWTVTIVFPNYSNRLTVMVGGSIYDTVASRVDIASIMGPHLHFMSTRSIFLDCKTVKFLSFKCRYYTRKALKAWNVIRVLFSYWLMFMWLN